MDAVLGTTVTVQRKLLNRALVMSSTPTCIPMRARCQGGSRDIVNGRRESLKRSEVLELLSTVMDALLLPANQKLLRERVRNSKRSETLSVEVSFPLKIVEPSPSEATMEISAPAQFGRGLSASTQDISREVNSAAEHPSTRVLNIMSEASVEECSLSPYFVQQVSSSGSLNEFEPPEEDESVHQGVQSIMSSTSDTGLSSETTSLSTMRRLKTLNVHDYVHSSLRESFLRSHLRSRKIEE